MKRTCVIVKFYVMSILPILFILSGLAIANCPSCPQCYKKTKDSYGNCGCADKCGQNQGCCNGQCYDYATQGCCNGQCYNTTTQVCCGGQVKDKGNCMACVDSNWISTCSTENCQTCQNNECVVCNGDPNKTCCNGSCCDKVWIKKTIPAIQESCPECVGNVGCAGNYVKITSSYDECSNVGVGSGEHCQCHSQTQTIGYTYHCINNFDVSKLLWCALRGGWCAAVCIETMSPSACANCLAGASVDCCDGTCELCDFIESCDPDIEENMVPVEAEVFKDFGC